MGIGGRDAAYVGFADERDEAGVGIFKACGFGDGRGEEAELDARALAGLGCEMEPADRTGGRVGFEIELEHLEQEGLVGGGDRGANGAREEAARLGLRGLVQSPILRPVERECNRDGSQGEGT